MYIGFLIKKKKLNRWLSTCGTKLIFENKWFIEYKMNKGEGIGGTSHFGFACLMRNYSAQKEGRAENGLLF